MSHERPFRHSDDDVGRAPFRVGRRRAFGKRERRSRSTPCTRSSRSHTAPVRVAVGPARARRLRGPLPRTTDPSTTSTNPVCAEQVRRPATPATPLTGSPEVIGHRPRQPVRGVHGRRLQGRHDQRFDPIRRPPPAGGAVAVRRPTRPGVATRNRLRHRRTVPIESSNQSASAVLDPQSAAANTICDRIASPAALAR